MAFSLRSPIRLAFSFVGRVGVGRVWILLGMVTSRSIRICSASFVGLAGWKEVLVWVGLDLRIDLMGLMSWRLSMGLLIGFRLSLMESMARFALGYFLLAPASFEPFS